MQQKIVSKPENLRRPKPASGASCRPLTKRRCHRLVRIIAPETSTQVAIPENNYVFRETLADFSVQITAMIIDLAFLILALRPGKAEVPVISEATIEVIDMKANPKARSGDIVPVFVTVRNFGPRTQEVELELSDLTDKSLIGRRLVSLEPDIPQSVSFSWNTGGRKLGDHLLDVRAILLQ